MRRTTTGLVVTVEDLANLSGMAWDVCEQLQAIDPDSDAHESARCVAKWLEAMCRAAWRQASTTTPGQLTLEL